MDDAQVLVIRERVRRAILLWVSAIDHARDETLPDVTEALQEAGYALVTDIESGEVGGEELVSEFLRAAGLAVHALALAVEIPLSDAWTRAVAMAIRKEEGSAT